MSEHDNKPELLLRQWGSFVVVRLWVGPEDPTWFDCILERVFKRLTRIQIIKWQRSNRWCLWPRLDIAKPFYGFIFGRYGFYWNNSKGGGE